MINKPFFIQINYIILFLLLCFLTFIILFEIINIRFNFLLNRSVPGSMNVRRGDRILAFLPLFHGYAFGMMAMAISCGAAVYTMSNFKLETLLSSVEKYRITHIPLVPPVLVGLAKHPMVPNCDFSSVREILCGAAPLPLDVSFSSKLIKIENMQNTLDIKVQK